MRAAAPRHPALPGRLFHWQGIFADDHGAAFDERGWGYYTREWADAWYPGYSDAWGSLTGAIGMLYEQGRNQGMPLMRESGEVVPYREAVHGQLVASLANLETLREHVRMSPGPTRASGRQEMLENLVARYVERAG